MQEQNSNFVIRKNLLDLKHARYLQYLITSIIAALSYAIGITLGILTKQIDFKNLTSLLIVGLASLTIFGIIGFLVMRFKLKLDNIDREIAVL